MSDGSRTLRRPEARAEPVEDLVNKIRHGEVRVPAFQRGLRWRAEHVLQLFDSIYRGFPIGSLLLHQSPAPATEVRVGPLVIPAEAVSHALWVIDGQQRLTALSATLARDTMPTVARPEDPYAVYFDAETETFHGPPRAGEIPTTWVPVNRLLDATELSEWIHTWSHQHTHRKVVFEAGRRIREYPVPEYIIHSADDELLRTIFHRTNASGVGLTWSEVHDALYGHRGTEPSSVAQLAERLEGVGMGRPDEDELVSCLIAFEGLDPTRSLKEHLQTNPKVLDGVVASALPVIQEVLGFLRARAEIPHLRLLPYVTPLIVLTRFFRLHREPSERTRTLLVRWVWRSFLGGIHDDRVLKRRSLALSDDEEASTQELLKVVPTQASTFELPDRFDARSAHSRLSLLALASLQPRALDDSGVIEVAPTIQQHGVDTFRTMIPNAGDLHRSPANRLILPGRGTAGSELRVFIETHGVEHPVLASQAISRNVAEALRNRDYTSAIRQRGVIIAEHVSRLGDRLAEWGRSDRPSIGYVLRDVG